MGDLRRARCKSCRRHKSEAGAISWSGLCDRCAREKVAENVTGLMDHNGPAFKRWRRGMAASVGAVILDDAQENP